MISNDKKKQIESLSTDEMLFEINLGRKSRFQREKFAYLKTCYQKRIEEKVLKQQTKENHTPNPTSESTQPIHKPRKISLYKIAEGVIVFILGVFAIYLIGKYLGINF